MFSTENYPGDSFALCLVLFVDIDPIETGLTTFLPGL